MSVLHIIPTNSWSWQHGYLIQINSTAPILGTRVCNCRSGYPSKIT